MSTNSIGRTWQGCAIVALAALASSTAWASPSAAGDKDATPLVIAQAVAPVAQSRSAAPQSAFPAHERGVRQAAAEGTQALRRYVWRTRMIYDFYYDDFAPKE